MTVAFTLRLDDQVVGALDALAVKTDQSRDQLVEKAIADFVALQSWQIAKVETGLAAADRGDFASEDELERLRDLESILDYVAMNNPRAAADLLERIEGRIEMLAAYSQTGRPGRVPGTRELVVAGSPFLVPYRLRGDDIEILAVLHSWRRWPESLP